MLPVTLVKTEGKKTFLTLNSDFYQAMQHCNSWNRFHTLAAHALKYQDQPKVRADLLSRCKYEGQRLFYKPSQTIPCANSSRELDERRGTCAPRGTTRHKVI